MNNLVSFPDSLLSAGESLGMRLIVINSSLCTSQTYFCNNNNNPFCWEQYFSYKFLTKLPQQLFGILHQGKCIKMKSRGTSITIRVDIVGMVVVIIVVVIVVVVVVN